MKPLKQKIEEAADEYAFQVPYDGTKEFYDQTKLSGFKAGAQFMLDAGVRFTREDLRQAFENGADHHNYFDESDFEEWFNDNKSK